MSSIRTSARDETAAQLERLASAASALSARLNAEEQLGSERVLLTTHLHRLSNSARKILSEARLDWPHFAGEFLSELTDRIERINSEEEPLPSDANVGTWNKQLLSIVEQEKQKAHQQHAYENLRGSTDLVKLEHARETLESAIRVMQQLPLQNAFRAKELQIEKTVPQAEISLKLICKVVLAMTGANWDQWPGSPREDALVDRIVRDAHEVQVTILGYGVGRNTRSPLVAVEEIERDTVNYQSHIAADERTPDSVRKLLKSDDHRRHTAQELEQSMGRRMRKIYFPTRAQSQASRV